MKEKKVYQFKYTLLVVLCCVLSHIWLVTLHCHSTHCTISPLICVVSHLLQRDCVGKHGADWGHWLCVGLSRPVHILHCTWAYYM